jgi:predicted patatin/cPLA2 family phospholipase
MATIYDLLEDHKNNKKDKRVFGLVLQGGGMRAVYTSGAIVPLIKYGFTDAFEHGAMNGAYFLSKYLETKDVFIDELTNKNFVNLLRRDKKVDIDFLVDNVLKPLRPVDINNLKSAHAKLHTVVTNAKTGKKAVISDHHKFTKIYEEFRATAALPMLYDKKVMLDAEYYVDGGVADLIPIDVAIDLGCTDIIVIMTSKISSHSNDKRHKRLVKHLIRKFAKNQSKRLRKVLPTNEKILQSNIRLLSHPLKKIRIYALEPSDEEILFSLGTIDKPKVEELSKLGISDMDNFLAKQV